MRNMSSVRANIAFPPLPIYFLSLAVCFAVISVPLRQSVVHDKSFTIVNGILAGIAFSGIMAISVFVARRRLWHALGTSLTPRQQLSLSQSVEHMVIPQEPSLYKVFPAYVRYYIRLNHHSRLYIPLVLGSLSVMSAYLSFHTGEHIWLLYGSMFIALAAVGMRGVNRMLHKLERLEPRLQPVQHRQLQSSPVFHPIRPRQTVQAG